MVFCKERNPQRWVLDYLGVFPVPNSWVTKQLLSGDVQLSVVPSLVPFLPPSTAEPRQYATPDCLYHLAIAGLTVFGCESSLRKQLISVSAQDMLEVIFGSATMFGTGATILPESAFFPLLKVLPARIFVQ